jgi:hypothetical protein
MSGNAQWTLHESSTVPCLLDCNNMIWDFQFEGGAHPWHWRCVDPRTGSLIRRSSGSFNALWECAEDALQHGYVRIPAQMATSFAAGLSRASGCLHEVPPATQGTFTDELRTVLTCYEAAAHRKGGINEIC